MNFREENNLENKLEKRKTLYKSKLFLTYLSSYIKLVENIFCKKEAIGYKAVLIDETMKLLFCKDDFFNEFLEDYTLWGK